MLTEKVLKDHVAFRKKSLVGKQYFSHKDILIEAILRALVFSTMTEIVCNIDNAFREKVVEFRPMRFWSVAIGLMVITPIQLYLVNWSLRRIKERQ